MIRVVLADDEPRILQALERRVDWEEMGLEIAGTATNGNTALELVHATDPDLLITDIRMPGLNGIDLARSARKYKPSVEVILISGFSEFRYAQEGIDIGVLGYLLKPIQQKELDELLGRAVDMLKKKSDEIDAGWYQFRSFVARANASGKLYEHMVTEEIVRSGDTVFCMLTSGAPPLTTDDARNTVYRRPVGPRLTAYVFSGSAAFCAESRMTVRNYHAHHDGISGLGSTITDPLRIEQTILESEAAFVRASFYPDTEIVEYGQGDPDIGPLVQDAIKSIERQQYETVRSLLPTLRERTKTEGCNVESLYYFYNSLVIHARNYYSLKPATGLIPRPFGSVIDLTLRYRSLRDLFEDLEGMVNYVATSDIRTSETPKNTMGSVREYISNHFSEDLSMDHLSDVFGIEKNQLSQRFKSVHGKGISEVIREIRIEHAKFLLTSTTMPVATVGELCGYGDYYYFARVFKRETGYTCSQFRDEVSAK